jgi:hypothetical protein
LIIKRIALENKIIKLLLIIILFSLCNIDHPNIEARELSKITVDSSKSLGKIPYLYKTGIYLWFFPGEKQNYSLKRFFSDNKLGVVKIPLDVDVFIPSKNMQDLNKRLSKIDHFAQSVEKKGGQVAILIHEIPAWLSSSKSDEPVERGISGSKANISPPEDYKKWSELVGVIVNHFNNELKLDALYIIWTEPNLNIAWAGTEEEYFKLYKYAVLGARLADPKAKVGGPAVSSWTAKRNPPPTGYKDRPFLYNFLEYCGKNGIKELGLSRIPLDFIVVHSFNNHPALWDIMAADVKGWLREFGFDPRTPLFVAEWSSWEGPPTTSNSYSSKDHDTEFVASYIIATLSAMNKAGISYDTFTTLFDPGSSEDKEFTGNFGIFTNNMITKASYNSFKMLSMLKGDLIQSSANDPFLYTIASKNRENIFLIISNFIPTPKMYKRLIAEELEKRGHHRDTLKPAQQDIINYLKGNNSGNAKLPEKLRNDLNEIIKKYNLDFKASLYREKNPVTVEISFEQIPDKKYRVDEYLIDSNHSNAFAYGGDIEKSLSEIRKGFKAKKLSKDSALKQADSINDRKNIKLEKMREGFLRKNDSNYSYRVLLKPYSVMLIMLQPESASPPKAALRPPKVRLVR